MIIITGLEMPNNCAFCPLNYDMVGCSVSDKVIFDYSKIDHQRNENCPLKDISCKTCKHRPEYAMKYDPDSACPYLCSDPYYSRVPYDDSFCDEWEAKDEKIPGNG